MPELTLTPADADHPEPDQSGDCHYDGGTIIDYTNAANEFGKNSLKTPAHLGASQLYDFSAVPLGSRIKRWKAEVKAARTDNTTTFTMKFDFMALDPRLDSVVTAPQNAQYIFTPSHALFSVQEIWDDSRSSGNDQLIPYIQRISYGIGRVAQAWTANDTQNLIAHHFYCSRTGTWSGFECRVDLYAAGGAPGSHVKGDLLNTGTVQLVSNIGTSISLEPFLGTSPFYQVQAGTTYVSEWTCLTTAGTTDSINFGMLTTADGSTDNAYNGDHPATGRKPSSFGGYAQWVSGADIKDAAKAGSGSSFTSPLFTNNVNHTFGNPTSDPDSYAHDTDVANGLADLQAALDARTSLDQRIGIRLQDFVGSDANRSRKYHSVRSATATSGSDKGMLLTIEHTSDSEYLRRYEHMRAPNPSLRM